MPTLSTLVSSPCFALAFYPRKERRGFFPIRLLVVVMQESAKKNNSIYISVLLAINDRQEKLTIK